MRFAKPAPDQRRIIGGQRPFLRLLALLLLGLMLVACGGTAVSAEPTPTLSPEVIAGRSVFTRECASCHSTAPDTIIVGPSLAGIATHATARVPGQDAPTYLLTSIVSPTDFTVPGYENLMPENFAKTLTGEEIDALVAYMLTLE